MHRLTRQQKIENLLEVRNNLLNKKREIDIQLEGISRKIAKLQLVEETKTDEGTSQLYKPLSKF
jgi:DNA-directed RNA polymerase delta subunit